MLTRRHRKILMRPVIRFAKFHILHIDDSAHSIALGVAVGLFCAFMPPLGIHILLALLLAFVFKANKATALAGVWLSNPFTLIPIYLPCYFVGRGVLSMLRSDQTMPTDQVVTLLKEYFSISHIFTKFFTAQFWHEIGSLFAQIGFELVVGGLIIGSVIATAGYYATRAFVIHHRQKKPRRRYRHLA